MTHALIFDYDGLIVDSETQHARTLLEVLGEDGVRAELSDIAHLYGGTGPELDRAWSEFMNARYGSSVDLDDFEARFRPRLPPISELPMLPGVAELMAKAKAAGWRVGLATGKERERLQPELDRHELNDVFDAVVTSEDVTNGKPAPDIFLAIADQLNVKPAECIVLEDSLSGSLAALAAGMRVIVCPCEVTRTCDFPQEAEVVATLEGLNVF